MCEKSISKYEIYTTKNEFETQNVGEKLSDILQPADVILLYGNLGAGKTCFVKGIARGLGIDPCNVTSPTFVILNEYYGKYPLYHFDFYRIKDFIEIENVGFFDYITSSGITVVEWPEKVEKFVISGYKVKIDIKEYGVRVISIEKMKC